MEGGTEYHFEWKSKTYLDPFNYTYEGGCYQNKGQDTDAEKAALEKQYRIDKGLEKKEEVKEKEKEEEKKKTQKGKKK